MSNPTEPSTNTEARKIADSILALPSDQRTAACLSRVMHAAERVVEIDDPWRMGYLGAVVAGVRLVEAAPFAALAATIAEFQADQLAEQPGGAS
ncbi:hypothetical protein AB0I55_29365 [Actinocatenispora sera]|uniref:hypothetical protein n=1 Tax=Actinocatenispora sera TaxID=390989 RepID=UPI0033CE35FA